MNKSSLILLISVFSLGAADVPMKNLPHSSSTTNDFVVGVKGGASKLFPAPYSVPEADAAFIKGNAATNSFLQKTDNGSGLTNLSAANAHAITNFNGSGTNTIFKATVSGTAAGIGQWQYTDGAFLGALGQSILSFTGETNARIHFSGANGNADIHWFRNHANNTGSDPELVFSSSGSIAFGAGQGSIPGFVYLADRAFQLGVGLQNHEYIYLQRESIPWNGVNANFGCVPLQFASYFTNGDGNLYAVGHASLTALNFDLPTLTCNSIDRFGRARYSFWDFFDNSVPDTVNWNFANSRRRFDINISTNIDDGGFLLFGRAGFTNITTTGTSSGTLLWDWDGTSENFYQLSIWKNAQLLVRNGSGNAVLNAQPGFNLVDIGSSTQPCDLRVQSGSDNYFQAGPNGIFAANLRVGGTHQAVAAQTFEVNGTVGVSGATFLTNGVPIIGTSTSQTPMLTNFTSYASGTAYTLTGTPAQLAFGTTSPGITIQNGGTYLIRSGTGIKYNAATYGGAQTITLKLRRTNNTPADLTNGGRTVELPVLTTYTGGDFIATPDIIYTATAGDIVQLFGSVSATPSAGSVTTDSAEIIAIRLF